ncbi:MAG TPA: P-loop NTPase fold protein, partial [Solirubrobacter sp.]|nr:P-loop NTPase fold protein [Solirubrobacter sp.]
MAGPVIRRRVVVHGRVAGVGLRAAVLREAVRVGAAGWVRNNADGTVEAVFEGEPETVESMVAFCRDGPHRAVVTDVVEANEEPEGLEGFSVAVASPREPAPTFAGFAADNTSGTDLLGVQERVDLLCSVLAAKTLETPLAVALFGDWGSGKSFFMHRMQERVDALAASAAAAEHSLYCTRVTQVRFNAWSYADSDIWASLAAHIFRAVAGEGPPGSHDHELEDFWSAKRAESERLADAEAEIAALEQRRRDLDARIDAADDAVLEPVRRAGPVGRAVALAAAGARDGYRGGRALRASWAKLGRRGRLLLAGTLALAVACVAVAVLAPQAAPRVIAAAGAIALAGTALAVAGRVATGIEERERLIADREAVERELEALRGEAQLERHELGALRDEPLLYAAAEAERWEQRRQLGVITEIRLRLERLSELIDRSRERPESPDTPPIDRVIVYVDDLDRCSPSVVLKTLESIKLLLDLRNFVVVVGVASSWLVRSLEVMFKSMLESDGALEMSPQRYLEKIFQYSLVLPPMSADGFRQLAYHLLPPAETAAPAGAAAETATVEAQAPPERREDPAPRDLVVTDAEREFVTQLWPLFKTPRALKRMTNLYRLIRFSLGEEDVLNDNAYAIILYILGQCVARPDRVHSV